MTDRGAAPPGTRQVAHLLSEIGTMMELNGRDPFRARAFINAARALDGADADLPALAREGRLATLRGVGPAIAAVIEEYLLTGHSDFHDSLRAETPPGLYDLMRVPGLGNKRIHTLYASLGIDNLDALQEAAEAGRVAALAGFGPRTEAKILEGIAFARSTRQRRRYPEALEVAARLVDWLDQLPAVEDAAITGALRRRLEVVDEIRLLASSTDVASVLRAFQALEGSNPSAAASSDDADEAAIQLSDGMLVCLRCVPPVRFVHALLWETGNDQHRQDLALRAERRGGRFDREGLVFTEADDTVSEEEAYSRLGLAYVPPELREGLGELQRAEAGEISLVSSTDLQGTFHCHTTYSDGKASLREMAAAARDLGWSYLGTGDHSRSAGYAGGMTIERVRQQFREIDGLNQEYARAGSAFRIFRGIESDILPDGSLDYPDDVLSEFDYVVASIHSSFGMSREEMTGRMVGALQQPAVTILGHPTGRLLLTREGYSLDVDAVIRAAAENHVVIEINANPHRLDLDWRYVRTAAELGILFAVNPDAHSVAALEHVVFGINMARKAGLEPRQVLNTWSTQEVAEYFAAR